MLKIAEIASSGLMPVAVLKLSKKRQISLSCWREAIGDGALTDADDVALNVGLICVGVVSDEATEK